MKAAPFDYMRADSIASCVRALQEADGDGKIIAGGQSLAPVLAMRLARPRLLVDINRIPGISSVERHHDELRMGAMVLHADLLEQQHSPLLAAAAKWIGHPAIRSRGTLGGSICHSDPSGEWPVVAAALEARLTIHGRSGSREATAGDFFLGPLEPDLQTDEVLVGIDMPIPETWGFAELSRRHGDFGLVMAVTALVRGTWRVAVGGIAGVPLRVTEAESLLNESTSPEAARAAAKAAAAAVTPSDDLHASSRYRSAMVEEYTHRSINQAIIQTPSHHPVGVS
jgi:carbon-monoxide dehydrogenase medium subunit